MTRLNGIPSQMLAMSTESSAVLGSVSQLTCPMPKALRTELTIPYSLLSIHDHTEPETMSGSSHGMRKAPRRTPESGKLRWKKTASASPMAYCAAMEPRVETAVLRRAVPKAVELSAEAWLSRPTNSASHWTKARASYQWMLRSMLRHSGQA